MPGRRGHTVVIGWDRPLNTFFAQVFDPGGEVMIDRGDDRDVISTPADAIDLDLTGLHATVRAVVLRAPGAAALVDELTADVVARPTGSGVRLAIGCAGGRHRSVTLVEAIAARLRERGYLVRITHRDIHRPRVIKR
ncbi:glmZ(sRNA)-inactivating NTPase [Actinoalloteichus hoggarensis]|uniref:GlmZ(SRNA)-inactivating NTPase n=2 Tax=Actinoalloteichus hoggarensis TaxID=1470176 RepID=A0A221W5A4_9PSEU|nr:glmZ(sRNA)-inactivating NTPase [Actinoalloteichus hoggarensis]